MSSPVIVKIRIVLVFGTCILFNLDGVQGRIYGGTTSNITEHPYEVAIRMDYRTYNNIVINVHYCAGSIINQDWVLSAAHCFLFSKEYFTIRAGSSFTNKGGSIYTISEIVNHSGYNRTTHDNDIALVKVSRPFIFSDRVQPIKLADEQPKLGTPALVAGWGDIRLGVKPSQIHEIHIEILNNTECQGNINDICAGDPEGKYHACHGDSGSPLLIDGKQVGIVSYSTYPKCKAIKGGELYTNVISYREWINSYIGDVL